MLTYLLFLLGFVILIKGADLLVEGAGSIAKKFHVSDIVIGLTIVAFGTSAPELVVNTIASYQGNSELAIANVLGSNIANIFIAIGLAAIISPLTVKRNTVLKEIPLTLLAAAVIGFVANDVLFDKGDVSRITRGEGFVMLCFFVIFLFYTLTIAKEKHEKPDEKAKVIPMPKSIGYIILGLVGLTVGGDWIVTGAIKMATALGMSEALIGVTIVAIGTSLPEIVTSAVSAYKGKKDIAIGNAVGSNLFNIFWVLALSAIVKPLPFDEKLNVDVLVNLLASTLLFLFLYVRNKEHVMKRGHGILFILLYVGYIVYSVIRG